MSLSKLHAHRAESECGSRCRSAQDARRLLTVLSAHHDLSEEQRLYYLATAGVCGQPGRAVDPLGRSLLHVAASLGQHRVVEWLLRFKEPGLNARDSESGYSALHRSLYQGHLRVAELLWQSGVNAALCDHEGLTPLDLVVRDDRRSPADLDADRFLCDVYVWGANTNYNLGVGHQQQRHSPDVLEYLRKDGIVCRAAKLQKFHSAFVSRLHQVYTCGHGRGGRLGHGNEESQLKPRLVKQLQDVSVTDIALGVDHTLFLTSLGQVWSCGLNTFYQLGHAPPPTQLLTPQVITWSPAASRKQQTQTLPPAVGIAASRFHSVFWTDTCVYTWGLNAGHLGHLPGQNQTVVSPKLVTSLVKEDRKIKTVVCSEGATIVLVDNGDLFALHEHKTRRITSHLYDVVKIEVLGGHLDPATINKVSSSSSSSSSSQYSNWKLVERGGQDLKVFILTKYGVLSVWEESRGCSIIPCTFNINRGLVTVKDVCLNKAGLLILTQEGLAYEGVHQSNKRTKTPLPKGSKDKLSDMADFVEKNPFDLVKLKRIPGVYRGAKAMCDPKGQNFCVLQVSPSANLYQVPEVDPSTMVTDMRDALASSCEMDLLHDVVIVVGVGVKERRFAAHRYLLACVSDKLSKLLVGQLAKKEVFLEDMRPEVFEQILKYAFMKTCDLLQVGQCSGTLHASGETNGNFKEDYFAPAELAHITSDASERKKGANAVSSNTGETSSGKGRQLDIFQALKDSCKRWEIHGLSKALENYRFHNGVISFKDSASGKVPRHPKPCFSRKSFPELHDVTLVSEDKICIPAHKCVLASRLDYFNSMFSMGWIEAKDDRSINLPVPANIVHVVLDYLYRDEALAMENSDDIEFICNCLVLADQLLIPRLIQLCERQLTQLLSLKNAPSLFEFAMDFGAKQLQESAMQFISQNLAAILESRLLATINQDYLVDLSDYYANFVPTMSKRRECAMRENPDDPGLFAPTEEDIKAHYQSHPITIDELFREEEALQAQESLTIITSASSTSGKKRSQIRRNSSGEKGVGRQRSSLSTGSVGSVSSDIENADTDFLFKMADRSQLSLDDFDLEEKQPSEKVLPLKAPVANKCGETSEQSKEILLSFFESVKENRTPGTADVGGKVFSKRFQKKSQKDRKKESELAQSSIAASPSETGSKWCGWGSASQGTATSPNVLSGSADNSSSLLEIMKKESVERPLTSTLSSSGGGAKPKVRTKKSSWKQLSFTLDDDQPATATATPANPWRTSQPVEPSPFQSQFPPNGHDLAFQDIVETEVRQAENTYKVLSKSLSVTQLEERAMEELRVFYNADHVFEEHITVARCDEDVTANMCAPTWHRHRARNT